MAYILETDTQVLNTIALRGIVVFPGTTTSFEIGRKTSINALKKTPYLEADNRRQNTPQVRHL